MPPKKASSQANGQPQASRPAAPKKQQQQQQQQQRQQQQPKTTNNQFQARQDGPSEAEFRKETSKMAKKSLEKEQEAKELIQAAAAAGDPDERQKLLEQALRKEIEAGTFGKLARWLTGGAAQGFIAGSTLGIGLGTLTGTLVGGLTSMLTGGIGAIAGYMQGPVVDIAGSVGSGVRKITGDFPGWKATPEQKRSLETMLGQVNETERPNEDELINMTRDWEVHGDSGYEGSWTQKGMSYMPNAPFSWSAPSWARSKTDSNAVQKSQEEYKKSEAGSVASRPTKARAHTGPSPGQAYTGIRVDEGPRKVQSAVTKPANASKPASKTSKPDQSSAKEGVPNHSAPKKKPRKLEVRKAAAGGQGPQQARRPAKQVNGNS